MNVAKRAVDEGSSRGSQGQDSSAPSETFRGCPFSIPCTGGWGASPISCLGLGSSQPQCQVTSPCCLSWASPRPNGAAALCITRFALLNSKSS